MCHNELIEKKESQFLEPKKNKLNIKAMFVNV